ncbi:unnamed protein product [Cylicostephanus goldi]|uniref:Uncharacterized protein n=1 Tax=Cylicostephanus goldi TaxID=71465 RepID=A0A3P6RMP4_CYLGO|nr:unnamed protein product [Cylicostephanus goldi]
MGVNKTWKTEFTYCERGFRKRRRARVAALQNFKNFMKEAVMDAVEKLSIDWRKVDIAINYNPVRCCNATIFTCGPAEPPPGVFEDEDISRLNENQVTVYGTITVR